MNTETNGLKWLTNTIDPKTATTYDMFVRLGETPNQAFRRFQDFMQGKVIGLPKATSAYTVEQLQAMKMVGVYEAGDNEQSKQPNPFGLSQSFVDHIWRKYGQ